MGNKHSTQIQASQETEKNKNTLTMPKKTKKSNKKALKGKARADSNSKVNIPKEYSDPAHFEISDDEEAEDLYQQPSFLRRHTPLLVFKNKYCQAK
mmetsp:Transcript_18929/g.18596  ORF Transcript_18929/g.18596 Transcript_18929/m.18596 type:complete len:96 (+) Transcript_18929:19-306(+)